MKRTIQSMSQVGTSPMCRENSLMTLPPLPPSSHQISSSSSWMGSDMDMVSHHAKLVLIFALSRCKCG